MRTDQMPGGGERHFSAFEVTASDIDHMGHVNNTVYLRWIQDAVTAFWEQHGIHKNQALVLVNYGTATGTEILEVAQNIQKTILEQFGISIEAEVNII